MDLIKELPYVKDKIICNKKCMTVYQYSSSLIFMQIYQFNFTKYIHAEHVNVNHDGFQMTTLV